VSITLRPGCSDGGWRTHLVMKAVLAATTTPRSCCEEDSGFGGGRESSARSLAILDGGRSFGLSQEGEERVRYPERLRRRQAARYLGTSEGFLEKAAGTGGGPAMIRISKRLVVYDRRDLDAWLQARRVDNTAQPTVV
jgi:hypothetical protein